MSEELAQAGSSPPLGATIQPRVSGFFPATQLRVSRTLSPLWSMVDVLQAWEGVAIPEKHSQQSLDHLSQQGYNKHSTAQR